MADAKNEAMLHQYVETQVATISPFKVKSEALKKDVEALVLDSPEAVENAKKLRKEIIAHENLVEGERKAITGQFDAVTKSLITLQRDVLAAAVEAKAELGKKVIAYEDELEKQAIAEKQRVQKILEAFVNNDGVSIGQIRSLKDLAAYEEKIEGRVTNMKPEHAAMPQMISMIADIRTAIAERRDTIRRIDQESNEAKQNDLQRQADQARAAKEAKAAEKAVAPAVVKTGSRTRMTFQIVNPDQVPRELCVPSEKLIREYINENNSEHLDGVLIKRERVL